MKDGVFCALAMLLVMGGVSAEESQNLSAEEIVQKSLLAYYYQGDDGKARINMELIDKSGKSRKRVMTMLRFDLADRGDNDQLIGGDQKFFIYFHEPGDVRRMTFMVHKRKDGNDDRWIFVPAVRMVRRISADDKRSSFVGSDFTYEDVSGRQAGDDDHTLNGTAQLGGKDCYLIESVPRDNVDYARKISWIDKETFLPLKEEYYNSRNELYRVFTAEQIQIIDSYPTPMKRTMKNLKTGHTTVVSIESASYNLGFADKDFSERSMRRPPRQWIR